MGHLSVMARNTIACERSSVKLIRTAFIELHQEVSESRRKWHKRMGQHTQLTRWLNLGCYTIHTVQRCTGHHAHENGWDHLENKS